MTPQGTQSSGWAENILQFGNFLFTSPFRSGLGVKWKSPKWQEYFSKVALATAFSVSLPSKGVMIALFWKTGTTREKNGSIEFP